MAKRLITGEILNGISTFKNGSGIHIKEKNKGTFTKYCNGKVTQACIDKAKRSGNKKLIKRVVFAENSRKWAKKHLEGGLMNPSITNWLLYPSKLLEFVNKQIMNQIEKKLKKLKEDFEHNKVAEEVDNILNMVWDKSTKWEDLSLSKFGQIPLIKDKRVKLTNAGKDTGAIVYTNMLDSIAKYADKAKLPLQSALGLVGQESTFGHGYDPNLEQEDAISSEYLISNWDYYDQNPYIELISEAERKIKKIDKEKKYSSKEHFNHNYNIEHLKYFLLVLKEGLPYAARLYKKRLQDLKHPLQHGFELYKTGKYNPGDPRHTRMVEERGEALMKSPEIQKWMSKSPYVNVIPTHLKGGLFTKLSNAIIKGMNNSGNYMVVPEKEASTLAKKIYNSVNPTLPYPDGMDKAIGLGIASVFADKNKMQYEVTDSTALAAWAKRLGIPYNNKHLPSNGDGTVRLPKSIESEIPVDTTFWKLRIKDNENLLKFYEARGTSKHSDRYRIVDTTLDNDRKTLQALRHTYKTGEPVVINENTFNSRQLVNRGEYDVDTTPLNVLHNYTILYDPKNNVMHYRDTYDFNQFEWGVPGIPFDIRGMVKLKNKK